MTSATAGSRAPSPSARSRVAWASGRTWTRSVELRGGSGESALFGEGAGGFVVAGPEDALRELSAEGERRGVAVLPVGEATGETVDLAAAETEVSVPLGEAKSAWRSLGRN